MNLGEILDRTFQIYRDRFLVFFAIAAVPALIVQGIQTADTFWFHLYSSAIRGNSWPPGLLMTRLVFSLGYYHFFSFFLMLLFPVILKLVSGIVLDEEIGARQGLRFFATRWRSYLWLSTLNIAAGLILSEILTIAVLFGEITLTDALHIDTGTGLESLWMIVLPLIAGYAAFLWIGSSLSLAIPSAAMEALKGFRALRRSWGLTRKSRLRIALAWIAVTIASWVLVPSFQWVLRLAIVWIARSAHSRWVFYTLYPIVSQAMNTLLSALFGPIYPIALTLFYYDQRIRKEGFDIERMMDAAGLNATATLPAGDGPTTNDAAEEGRA